MMQIAEVNMIGGEGMRVQEIRDGCQSTLLCTGAFEGSEVRVPWSPCVLGKTIGTHPSLRCKDRGKVREEQREKVRGEVANMGRDKMRSKGRGKVRDKVRGEVENEKKDKMRDKMRGQGREKVTDNVRRKVRGNFRGLTQQ